MEPRMDKYLRVESVGMKFETKKGDFIALTGIDLSIKKGEFVSLIGHSGCGKSTRRYLSIRVPGLSYTKTASPPSPSPTQAQGPPRRW